MLDEQNRINTYHMQLKEPMISRHKRPPETGKAMNSKKSTFLVDLVKFKN